jgi:hypothetical protein
MTTTLDPNLRADRAGVSRDVHASSAPEGPEGLPPEGLPPEGLTEGPTEGPPAVRPFVAAAIATVAAGLLMGGIFGSWAARGLGVFAALFGVGWAYLSLRSSRRDLLPLLFAPAALVVSLLALIPSGGGPGRLPELIRAAVRSGRLLRPPVPFDPGWRPIIILVVGAIGFAAAWVAGPFDRPKLGVAIPLPVVALTAISQPEGSQALAGILAFICILGSLAVLFGGDTTRAAGLGSEFELKRLVRGAIATVPLIGIVIALNSASFLFPKPVYDPADKPQKPKPLPLSALEDRVLFEVKADAGITGPWRTGVLDVYDGQSWRLPPFDKKRFKPVPGDGVIDAAHLGVATVDVTFTIRDFGDSTALPGMANPAKVAVSGQDLVFDPRAGIVRVPTGRAKNGLVYTMKVPKYPEAKDLEAAPPAGRALAPFLEVGKPPPAVRDMLTTAPANPWLRLDFLRKKLNDVVVAKGAGQPVDFTPKRVEEILVGNHEATPFEIVAAEALLARWAGVPSRIGFGFDGLNDEKGVLTVRPRNAAQFLEVYFGGYGWVPLSTSPPKAKAALDTDPNARFKPTIQPSSDVAVEIYIPVQLENLKLLYERIRDVLLQVAPVALALVLLYLFYPVGLRALRRRRRRRWASELGPRAQIAVEYAEFRDAATDLNVGDPYDTALEYIWKLQQDDEHEELAWLVSRTLYGDMALSAGAEDVRAAEDLSASLRRRLWRAQPFQTRLAALVSRASLQRPHTTEVPNIALSPLRRRPWQRVG